MRRSNRISTFRKRPAQSFQLLEEPILFSDSQKYIIAEADSMQEKGGEQEFSTYAEARVFAAQNDQLGDLQVLSQNTAINNKINYQFSSD